MNLRPKDRKWEVDISKVFRGGGGLENVNLRPKYLIDDPLGKLNNSLKVVIGLLDGPFSAL